jgi:hypothetical protein
MAATQLMTGAIVSVLFLNGLVGAVRIEPTTFGLKVLLSKICNPLAARTSQRKSQLNGPSKQAFFGRQTGVRLSQRVPRKRFPGSSPGRLTLFFQ